jgi:hypothetical protein
MSTNESSMNNEHKSSDISDNSLNNGESIDKDSENTKDTEINKVIGNDTTVLEKKEVNYYLMEFNKILKKFTAKNCKFDEIFEEFDDISKVSLYELITAHHQNNTIILPIYKGVLVKKDTTLNNFASPLLLIKLDINLLVNKKVSEITPVNIFNSFSNMDASSIINSIMSQMGPPALQNPNDEGENAEDANDEGNIINSQNDIQNFTRQLMNIYSNSTQNMNNIRAANETKYKDQIEQISAMGFNNKEKIIQSLIVCNGDVEQAINYYLSMV